VIGLKEGRRHRVAVSLRNLPTDIGRKVISERTMGGHFADMPLI
jgi:hypothetical protein